MLDLVLRMLVGGGVVVGCLLLWRHLTRTGLAARGAPVLRVLGRAGLTRNALVAVVQVEGRRYLVGAADQGVRLLAELGQAEEHEAAAADTVAGAADDRATTVATAFGAVADAAGRGVPDHPGPRIGPLDRLREMTVRSHLREPIRAHSSDSD